MTAYEVWIAGKGKKWARRMSRPVVAEKYGVTPYHQRKAEERGLLAVPWDVAKRLLKLIEDESGPEAMKDVWEWSRGDDQTPGDPPRLRDLLGVAPSAGEG